MVLVANTFCGTRAGPCSVLLGRVVARIHGALGAGILVGLDGLVVCRCQAPDSSSLPREPWSYDELLGAEVGQYGSLPVVMIRIIGRREPLAILVLERDQIADALDGLVTLRRLIAAAGTPTPITTLLPRGLAS